jgi:hypothetical protein
MTVVDMAEARRAKRRPVLDMALIRIGRMSFSCIVYNLTDAGAALDIGSQSAIPDQFTLIVLPKTKTYSCNVVWRTSGRIGVSFR